METYYKKYLKYKSKYINYKKSLTGGNYLVYKNEPSTIIDDIIAENESVILLNDNIPIFKSYGNKYYNVIDSEHKNKKKLKDIYKFRKIPYDEIILRDEDEDDDNSLLLNFGDILINKKLMNPLCIFNFVKYDIDKGIVKYYLKLFDIQVSINPTTSENIINDFIIVSNYSYYETIIKQLLSNNSMNEELFNFIFDNKELHYCILYLFGNIYGIRIEGMDYHDKWNSSIYPKEIIEQFDKILNSTIDIYNKTFEPWQRDLKFDELSKKITNLSYLSTTDKISIILNMLEQNCLTEKFDITNLYNINYKFYNYKTRDTFQKNKLYDSFSLQYVMKLLKDKMIKDHEIIKKKDKDCIIIYLLCGDTPSKISMALKTCVKEYTFDNVFYEHFILSGGEEWNSKNELKEYLSLILQKYEKYNKEHIYFGLIDIISFLARTITSLNIALSELGYPNIIGKYDYGLKEEIDPEEFDSMDYIEKLLVFNMSDLGRIYDWAEDYNMRCCLSYKYDDIKKKIKDLYTDKFKENLFNCNIYVYYYCYLIKNNIEEKNFFY